MARTNDELVQELIRDGYLRSPLLIEALRAIDRKNFVPKEFWSEAYGNYPLPIGEGQTISQPLTVAFMLELLDPRPGEKILDVGSGSGWTSALLSHCVSVKIQKSKSKNQNGGLVVAAERIPELCEFGEKNIGKYNFLEKRIARYFCGDASRELPAEFMLSGGFDKILSGAAAQKEIPELWKKILKIGGRIVAPVGTSVVVLDKTSEEKFRSRDYPGFSFVPLISNAAE